MKVAIALLVIHFFFGEAVRLENRRSLPGPDGEFAVTIQCVEEENDQSVIGEVRSLAIETVTIITSLEGNVQPGQTIHRYIMRPVVELDSQNQQKWGPDYDYISRSSLTGSIATGRSVMTLYIRQFQCKDNAVYICVAAGRLGTVDSNQKVISSYNNVEDSPVIKGGRRCQSPNAEASDRCDIYASLGETFTLKCKLKVGLPVNGDTVRWQLNDGNSAYDVTNAVTMFNESSSKTCETSLTSTLQYRHVPWGSSDVIISCHVSYPQINTSMMVTKSVQLIACTEDADLSHAYMLNDGELAGVFMAGVIAMIIIILIVATCVACCGHSVKVYKKNNIAVTRM